MKPTPQSLGNPLFNVLALLFVGTIGMVLTTSNTATSDPTKSEFVINWVPLIIVGIEHRDLHFGVSGTARKSSLNYIGWADRISLLRC